MKDFSSFLKQSEIDKVPNTIISREMIDIQHDTGFIEDIVKSIQNYNKTEAAKEISKILTKRFGHTIKILPNYTLDYFCLPLNIGRLNVLYKDDVKESVQAYADIVSGNEHIEEINSLQDYTDVEQAFYNMLVLYKKSLKDQKLNNVEIDLKKAKITGLPSEYISYVSIDLRTDNPFQLSPHEIAAVILHEIGHTFTYIENAYRQIRTNTILLETLRNEVDIKGKPLDKALRLAYKNIFKEEPKTTSTKVLLSSFIENYSYQVAYTDNAYAQTDSEALADQFVSRLNMNNHLAKALDKMYTASGDLYKKNNIFLLQPIIDVFNYSRFLQIVTISGGLLLVGLPFLLVLAGILVHHDSEDNITTYDDIVRRYQRMKLDSIRILRQYGNELDRKYKSQFISNIEMIEKIILTYNKTDRSLINQILSLVSNKYSRTFDARKSQQLIEDLMENDIYTGVEKLKIRNI